MEATIQSYDYASMPHGGACGRFVTLYVPLWGVVLYITGTALFAGVAIYGAEVLLSVRELAAGVECEEG